MAIGISALLETISIVKKIDSTPWVTNALVFLGAMLTAVILMIGSVLVILENVTKIVHPQPVNENGILWLGIIAVAINMLASLVVLGKGKTKNESILSLHFLEDTLGWLAVILMAIILDLQIGISSILFYRWLFYLYSVESHSSLFGLPLRFS